MNALTVVIKRLYSELNMGSIANPRTDTITVDDRSTRARIRDAAIQCFAEHGVSETTARKVAALADVSPGSVIHHFESMDGLREACDQHILAFIRDSKSQVMESGPNLDLLGALREATNPHLMQYLARILIEDGEAVSQLVDGLVSDAEGYLAEGVASGMLKPTTDTRARAVILTLWSLGSLVMHRHLTRLLGVDLVDPDFGSNPEIARYLAPVMEIYGNGIFTTDFLAATASSLSRLNDVDSREEHQAPTKGTS